MKTLQQQAAEAAQRRAEKENRLWDKLWRRSFYDTSLQDELIRCGLAMLVGLVIGAIIVAPLFIFG